MDVRESSDERHDDEVDPWGCLLVEGVESNEQRKGPYLQEDRRTNPAVDHLAEVAEEEQCEQSDDLGGHAQKVGLCSRVAEIAQKKCEVRLRWLYRYCTNFSVNFTNKGPECLPI